MTSRYRNARPSFAKRSRAARRAEYIRTVNLIRRAATVLGGRFYSQSYMHGGNSWIDLRFLGNRPLEIFSVAMQTTRNEYKEKVFEESYKRADALVPPGEISVAVESKQRYPEFGGLSRIEWAIAQQPAIADERIVKVHERWIIQKNYYTGTGLQVTLDVPAITIEAVHNFMDRLLANPIPFNNPRSSTYTAADIKHWCIDANAVAEPWDWHLSEVEQEPKGEQ